MEPIERLSDAMLREIRRMALSPAVTDGNILLALTDEIMASRTRAATAGEWTAEMIAEYRELANRGRGPKHEGWRDRLVEVLDALEATQASALQSGEVAVREDDLRALVETHVAEGHCENKCFLEEECGEWVSMTPAEGEAHCRAALLAHFGLVPAQGHETEMPK